MVFLVYSIGLFGAGNASPECNEGHVVRLARSDGSEAATGCLKTCTKNKKMTDSSTNRTNQFHAPYEPALIREISGISDPPFRTAAFWGALQSSIVKIQPTPL